MKSNSKETYRKAWWILGIIIVSTIFQMCEPAGTENEAINNMSDSIIYVKFQTKGDNLAETKENTFVRIDPKTNKVISIFRRGIDEPANDDYQDSLIMFSFIKIAKISQIDTIYLPFNFKLRNFWIYSAKGKWSIDYKLTIKNENLIK